MKLLALAVAAILLVGCGDDDETTMSSAPITAGADDVSYFAEISRENPNWDETDAIKWRELVCGLKQDGLTLEQALDDHWEFIGRDLEQETRIAWRWC